MEKIPVTLVTGFLGAGKTTLINQLLKANSNKQIAVIINEYGAIGVDHEFVLETDEQIFQMNNGCVCCTLRADIANLLRVIWDMREEGTIQVSHIIFETTGLADPAPILQTFLQVPFLKEQFKIDSILTVVDASNLTGQLERQAEPQKQLAVADKVLLSKTKNLAPALVENVLEQLQQINPLTEIIFLEDFDFSRMDLLALEAFSVTQEILALPETHSHPHKEKKHSDDHHPVATVHNTSVRSFVLQTSKPLDLAKITRWFDGLVTCYGPDLYRYKGILAIDDRPQQLIFQGVHMTFDFSLGKNWTEKERQSTLVLIGRNLPELEIRSSFNDYFC